MSFGLSTFAYFFWNPSPEMFHWNLPFIGRPILWYGFLFALGMYVGYLMLSKSVRRILSDEKGAILLRDSIFLAVVIGTVVGARIGDVLFYQDITQYFSHPLGILKTWNGGLSSHGAVIGIICAFFFLSFRVKNKWPNLTTLPLLDAIVIPAAFTATFIRIGNFFNQEILGKATNLPWAIVFGSPAGGGPVVPRHPAQLYEALFYFLFGLLMIAVVKKHNLYNRKGVMIGLLFSIFFVFRFLIEFCKEEQSELLQGGFPLTMGQILSLPLILIGLSLIVRGYRKPLDELSERANNLN